MHRCLGGQVCSLGLGAGVGYKAPSLPLNRTPEECGTSVSSMTQTCGKDRELGLFYRGHGSFRKSQKAALTLSHSCEHKSVVSTPRAGLHLNWDRECVTVTQKEGERHTKTLAIVQKHLWTQWMQNEYLRQIACSTPSSVHTLCWKHAKIFQQILKTSMVRWKLIPSPESRNNLPERQRALEKANFSRMASSNSSSEFNLISPLWSLDCPLWKKKKKCSKSLKSFFKI